MDLGRRAFGLGGLVASAGLLADAAGAQPRSGEMYGLISQLVTKPEHRDELVEILVAATRSMPGCLGYVVALDETRADAVWVTEVWPDQESHAASLERPEIKAAMAKGRPLITGMGVRATTQPIAGA